LVRGGRCFREIRVMPKQIKQISQTIKEPEIIEATTLEQAKKVLSNGYTYAGNFNGTTLYTKNT
jgi:hypothetical protein